MKEGHFVEHRMPGLFWTLCFLGFLFLAGLQGAGEQKGVGVLNLTALAYCSD